MATIDYSRLVADCPSDDLKVRAAFLMEELPHQWADAYADGCTHKPNLLRITIGGFEYIFDFVQQSVERGIVQPADAVEDRVVAVHGKSVSQVEARRDF